MLPRKRPSDENSTLSNKRPSLAHSPDNLTPPSRTASQYWIVQWRSPQAKKHKTWEGDAVIAVSTNRVEFYDMEGKPYVFSHTLALGEVTLIYAPSISAGIFKATIPGLEVDMEIQLGGRDIHIDCSVSSRDFLSGRCFGRSIPLPVSHHAPTASVRKDFVPLRPVGNISAAVKVKSAPKSTMPLRTNSNLNHQSPRPSTPVIDVDAQSDPSYWSAMFRKPQQAKNKGWEADGYVSHVGTKLTLLSDDGKLQGTSAWKGGALHDGQTVFISGKEVQILSAVSSSEFPKQQKASNTFAIPDVATSSNTDPDDDLWEVPKPKSLPKPPIEPVKNHDPDAEDAFVMRSPNEAHEEKFNRNKLSVVPVVVDPLLSKHLRPHQKEGVKFMYDCVMGFRKHGGQGCILADEMGMGKTLQTITLIWTLLKQNPYAKPDIAVGKVLIVCPVTLINNWRNEFHKWLGRDRIGIFVGDQDKAIIKQFANSKIHQVLIIGYEKLRTVIPPIDLIVCDEAHRLKSSNNKSNKMFESLRTPRRILLTGTPIQNDLSEFHAMGDFCNPGLLADYNTFRRVYEVPIMKFREPGATKKDLELGKARFDQARLLQLSAVSKTFVLRRDATILSKYLPPKVEYVVFVRPTKFQLDLFNGILGSQRILSLTGQSTACSLSLITSLTKICISPATDDSLSSQFSKLYDDVAAQYPPESSNDMELSGQSIPLEEFYALTVYIGKLILLGNLLEKVFQTTEEKCVIVSHYTSTLDVIEAFCKQMRYTYSRLDGQTPVAKRQPLVTEFNKSSQEGRFLFLLSAKAGGVGLNLIGASRLVLVDSDWNPSHDLQAMARIHRDGQKRPVFIYRLVTTGAIDEKIYQRQISKTGLSDCDDSDTFTFEELRDLFTIHTETQCHTHDVLGCQCRTGSLRPSLSPEIIMDPHKADKVVSGRMTQRSEVNASKRTKSALASLGEWDHINCLRTAASELLIDKVLGTVVAQASNLRSKKDREDASADPGLRAIAGGTATFIFERESKSTM
ncbi:hypothetical protein SISSUDRAFT_1068881 [Sistotremastrum suecicum HHB10207 ss-3]|uniref:DNA repair and recombination protein RAD54B n=1 Tax=Sistotremastrum suecicum HHB10207 ss-3 TaxID=1314776 RepID=A0A166IEM6_9AGAM|nr:hypothetical protein SISSUDRAFT_1068881 [Sistotremastrum suecicum HHB10207 ss-3]